ncbi:MAG: hypothetical protein IPK19_39295 [Chloroflexi bacterium]|nr:hypothetical protein [Chloroflexota bacterium]
MSIEALVDEIRTLPVEERKRLIMLVLDTLTEPSPSVPAKRSILELAGFGRRYLAGDRCPGVCR